jgi:hypothetical protein
MRRGHTCASVGPNLAGVNFAASARPPAAAPHAKDVWCWCSRSYLPTSTVLEMPTCGPYTIQRLPPSGTWCAYALKPARPRTYACAQAACPNLWRDAPELPMNGIPARPPITNASPYAVRKRSGRSPCAHACTSGLAPACSLTDRLTHTSIVIPTQALFTAANADTNKHNSHDRSCPHREGRHTHAHTKAHTQTHTHTQTHKHTRTHARKCTQGGSGPTKYRSHRSRLRAYHFVVHLVDADAVRKQHIAVVGDALALHNVAQIQIQIQIQNILVTQVKPATSC